MPSLSTHINFLKILGDRGLNNFNNNYFLLGSIAPDYYINFYDEKMSCISHFKSSLYDKSNLIDFVRLIGNRPYTYKEKSYIKGYYSHLWLDNYSVDYGDCLEIKKPNGIDEKNIKLLIKENIKMYDLKNTKKIINKAELYNCTSDEFINIIPISIEKSLQVLNSFVDENLRNTIDNSTLIVVKEIDYYKFIENAVDTFLSESSQL